MLMVRLKPQMIGNRRKRVVDFTTALPVMKSIMTGLGVSEHRFTMATTSEQMPHQTRSEPTMTWNR